MYKVMVNNYLLQNPKLSNDKVIANISDIHGNIIALKYIMSILKCIKLDCICIPGDTIDTADQANKEVLISNLKKFSEISRIILSLGNHDTFEIITNKDGKKSFTSSDSYKEFYQELNKEANIIGLTENFESINLDHELSISALNLPLSWYDAKNHEDARELVKFLLGLDTNIDPNKFNILLSHSPNGLIQNNKIITNSDIINKMNLILSGHNHGGLVPASIQDIIKHHRGLVGPYRLLQPNAYGVFNDKDKSLLISNGITKLSKSSAPSLVSNISNKIFIPEVDLIHMIPGESHTLKLEKRIVHKL